MNLFVCYGTFGPAERHPCGKAHQALRAAGHRPQVVRTCGCYGTDRLFAGRREIKRLTGNYKVPTLILDDGTVIGDSSNIVAWTHANRPEALQARGIPLSTSSTRSLPRMHSGNLVRASRIASRRPCHVNVLSFSAGLACWP